VFQPLAVLLKVGALEQVLFVEYTHRFLEEYLRFPIPRYLNEILCYGFYQQSKGKMSFAQKNSNLLQFEEMTNYEKHLKDRDKSQIFLQTAFAFSFYLRQKYGSDFLVRWIHDNQGETLEETYLRLTQKSLRDDYYLFFKKMP
jgi:hypothetical protein